MRIAIIVDYYSASCGGCEKIATLLANHLSRKQHEITFITLNGVTPGTGSYFLSDEVKALKIDFTGNKIKKLKAFIQAIKRIKPSLVITFHVYSMFLSLFCRRYFKYSVIYSERGNPFRYFRGGMASHWFWIYRIALLFCDGLIFQTRTICIKLFPQIVRTFFTEKKTYIIGNPITHNALHSNIRKRHIIITASRLVKSKRIDILIKSFALIANDYPDWTLEIFGTGTEQDSLQKLIIDANLYEKVKIHPPEHDIASKMQQSEVFVLASEHEGFPNVILEAMSNGCAVISSDCDFGPKEIISDGVNGFLFINGSVEDCARKIGLLLSNEGLRIQFANNGVACSANYSDNIIFPKWETAIYNSITR